MPVNDTFNAEYLDAAPDWKICRDLYAGERAVKAAGEIYLPKLGGQTSEEYKQYKFRASVLGAFGRTVDGLVGMVGRKPAMRDLPAPVAKYADDIDLNGSSLDAFALNVTREMLTTGRCGLLVEFNAGSTKVKTLGDAERANMRPYLVMYPAESIVDWRFIRVNNRSVLGMVKLREVIQRPSVDDPWKMESVTQFRVLELVEGKFYEIAIYREVEREWVEVSRVRALNNGKPLPFIPFEFVGGPTVGKPPLLDLAYTNLQHYRYSADYENGLHWSGVPTPIFIGNFADVGPDGTEVREVMLGSSAGVHMREGSSAFFLEFQGTGLEGGLGLALDRAVDSMARLGARLLEDQKRVGESFETVQLHRQSETSMLAAVANMVSTSIVRCLGWFGGWLGSNEPSSFWLNKDFMPTEMSPQELTALLAAWQGGLVSMPEALERLKAGEIIRSDKSLEDHLGEIQEDAGRTYGLVAQVSETLKMRRTA